MCQRRRDQGPGKYGGARESAHIRGTDRSVERGSREDA
jgi:hypothetical protein